jgi:hypothetical protein
MKYIKLFEDLGNTYYKIDNQETFFDKIEEYEQLSFTEKEIDTLLSMGSEGSRHNSSWVSSNQNLDSIILFPNTKEFYLVIYKCNDEWFMCAKIPLLKMSFAEFYKCDQWDGLMDFIKHEFNI